MAFLSDDESASLTIRRMIMHVVGEGDFEPASEIDDIEEEGFFLDRIRDVDVDAVYSFDAGSVTRRTIGDMAAGRMTFEEGGQALARDFARFHTARRPREGVFFVFELGVDAVGVDLYALIKYDYSEAIEQVDGDGGAHLRRIVQALIGDKKAIQKSCLVRVRAEQVEDSISAHDRMKSGSDIGDYFASFLEAKRERSDNDLNRAAAEVVREVLTKHRDALPGRDVPRALREAKAALRARQQIDEEAIQEAVLAAAGDPEREEVRNALIRTVGQRAKARKLQGLQFRSDRQVWRRPNLTELKTREGVLVRYPDDLAGASVFREPRADGGETIRVETRAVVEVAVVKEGPSQAR